MRLSKTGGKIGIIFNVNTTVILTIKNTTPRTPPYIKLLFLMFWMVPMNLGEGNTNIFE